MVCIRVCCVPECDFNSSQIKMLRFSKPLFEVWKQIMMEKCPGLRRKLRSLTKETCHMRVCKLHFEAKFFKPDGTRERLIIPTLFTQEEIRTGKPNQPISLEHKKIGDVFKPKENDSTEVKEETKVKSSFEEHKLYCATHDHQYNVKSAVILTGVGSSPSPTPSEATQHNTQYNVKSAVTLTGVGSPPSPTPSEATQHNTQYNLKSAVILTGGGSQPSSTPSEATQHNTQYNVKSAVILTGVGSPPSRTPSEEKANDGFLPLEADPLADDVDDFQDITPEPLKFEEVKEEVKVDNLVKLPESLCAKPETEDDNAELYLLDILDPDLLTDSIEPENFGSLSDNLHNILSESWPPLLAGGLATEAKQKIIGRYPRPNNCKLLQTPTMNSKMVELVPEKIIANDDKWFKMQLCVGTAITAISRAMEMLMLCESRATALRHLTNSCLILCDLHYTHTKIRKINVTPFVDDTTKAVIKDCQKRDVTLFGHGFLTKWRAAKKLEPKPKKLKKKVPKSVKVKKKKATSSGPSLVAYSGQWHPPLQKVRNRRSMAGARRPPAGAAPQTPGRRRLRQPRPGGSPGGGVRRNRTKKLKQLEQYDAFSNEITSTPLDTEESYSHMQTDTEDRCVQGEVTDDVSKQSSITVERPSYGAGTKFTVMNSTKQIEHYDAWGNKISSTPPDIETSHPHRHTQMEARHTQVEPIIVDQLNTNKPKNPVKRKNPSDGTKPRKKRSTKKLQQTEHYDAFGNRLTSIPTSHPHMQIQTEGASRTRPVHEDPPSRRHTQAPHVQPSINYYPNNTVIITRGAIPLVLPPQNMPSKDMPTLHSNEMPVLHSNDDPPDLLENIQTRAQVRHGIVDTVTEVDTESGVSLLLQFRHS